MHIEPRPIPEHRFTDTFAELCFATMRVRPEARDRPLNNDSSNNSNNTNSNDANNYNT